MLKSIVAFLAVVAVTAASVCDLPKNRGEGCRDGSCLVYRYYFDIHLKNCRRFSYKGTGGNANNFETLMACRAECEPQAPTDPSCADDSMYTEIKGKTVTRAGEPLETLNFDTPGACLCACEKNPCCLAFVFDDKCYLYADQMPEEYHQEKAGAVYFTRNEFNPAASYSYEKVGMRSISSYSLEIIHDTTLEACQTECLSRINCLAAQFSIHNRCFIKPIHTYTEPETYLQERKLIDVYDKRCTA